MMTRTTTSAMSGRDSVTTSVDIKPGDTITNKHGGLQSKIVSALSLLPPRAIRAIGCVLSVGAKKYDKNNRNLRKRNWHSITWQEHLDHALEHLTYFMEGDTSGEDHLSHFGCRVVMMMEAYYMEEEGLTNFDGQ